MLKEHALEYYGLKEVKQWRVWKILNRVTARRRESGAEMAQSQQ
jgi:hypothetical protein